MERRVNVSPADIGEITATVMAEMDGRTITTSEGLRLYVERATNPDYDSKKWLSVTDAYGRVGHVYVGIGR